MRKYEGSLSSFLRTNRFSTLFAHSKDHAGNFACVKKDYDVPQKNIIELLELMAANGAPIYWIQLTNYDGYFCFINNADAREYRKSKNSC